MRNTEVERAAETHFFLRPVLVKALEQQLVTADGQQTLGFTTANYLEYWRGAYGDRWFDMTTMMRLGTAIETGLRDCFQRTAPAGTRVDRGLFQRLVEPTDLEAAFRSHCSVELATSPEWTTMREIMVNRHLYGHRAGVVDHKYLNDHLEVTGVDIRSNVSDMGYPTDDVYWFAHWARSLGTSMRRAVSFVVFPSLRAAGDSDIGCPIKANAAHWRGPRRTSVHRALSLNEVRHPPTTEARPDAGHVSRKSRLIGRAGWGERQWLHTRRLVPQRGAP